MCLYRGCGGCEEKADCPYSGWHVRRQIWRTQRGCFVRQTILSQPRAIFRRRSCLISPPGTTFLQCHLSFRRIEEASSNLKSSSNAKPCWGVALRIVERTCQANKIMLRLVRLRRFFRQYRSCQWTSERGNYARRNRRWIKANNLDSDCVT